MEFIRRLLSKEAEPPVTEETVPEALLDTGPTLVVGQASHIGRVRKRNEDAYFTLQATFSRNSETASGMPT